MKKEITFITGNQDKADYLSRYLDYPVTHKKVNLDEIQSLDLQKIVQHKIKQAKEHVTGPLFVEDVSLEFAALGGLPGPFIKWFMEAMSLQDIVNLVKDTDRSATARCVFGYFDGEKEYYFEGSHKGSVPLEPAGKNGYGWDPIFIPEGYSQTRAELSEEDDKKTYLAIKPFNQFKKFLNSNDI